MAGPVTPVERGAVEHGVDRPAVGAGQGRRVDAEQREDGGRDVDHLRDRAGHQPVGAGTGPADQERRPALNRTQGAVLADVAALLGPVVRRGVHDAEVGGVRVVEELGHLLEGEGVGVGGAFGEPGGELGVESGEAVRRTVPEGVPAGHGVDGEAPVPGRPGGAVGRGGRVMAAEPDRSVHRVGLVGTVASGQHHLDDRRERRVDEGRDGEVEFSGRRRHGPTVAPPRI